MLIESIQLKDGKAALLNLHQKRMDQARRALFPKSPVLKLAPLLTELNIPQTGLYKLRVEYSDRILMTEIVPYTIRAVRTIKVIKADHLDYRRKFSDRTGIEDLLAQSKNCDDILMTNRGYLMDMSYANIALHDGFHWYTPSYPMLRGVRREKLISEDRVRPAIIRDRDLLNFKKLRMMNAMMGWEEAPEVSIAALVY